MFENTHLENTMITVRLTMIVILLLQDIEHHNLSKSDHKKYQKYYFEITGKTWNETKHLYKLKT